MDKRNVMKKERAVQMEFHVSRHARDLYHFDESLFSLNGNALFANFHAARVFTQRMNAPPTIPRSDSQTSAGRKGSLVGHPPCSWNKVWCTRPDISVVG